VCVFTKNNARQISTILTNMDQNLGSSEFKKGWERIVGKLATECVNVKKKSDFSKKNWKFFKNSWKFFRKNLSFSWEFFRKNLRFFEVSEFFQESFREFSRLNAKLTPARQISLTGVSISLLFWFKKTLENIKNAVKIHLRVPTRGSTCPLCMSDTSLCRPVAPCRTVAAGSWGTWRCFYSRVPHFPKMRSRAQKYLHLNQGPAVFLIPCLCRYAICFILL